MNVKKLVALVLVAIVLAASLYGYSVYKKIFTSNTSFEQREVYIYIPTESDYQQMKNILNPYIENMEHFGMTAEKKGYLTNIKAGRFLLKKGMNNNDIVNALRQNIPIK